MDRIKFLQIHQHLLKLLKVNIVYKTIWCVLCNIPFRHLTDWIEVALEISETPVLIF